MTRRSAADVAGGRERTAAIRACCRCDESGWRLGPDGRASDLAVRCTHSSPPPVRDITEPIHEPGLFSAPRHQGLA